MNYWAVRRPIISTLCVGALWGFFFGVLMSIADVFTSTDDGPVVFNLLFFTVFGAIGFGSYWRWVTVRHVRKWEKANTVSTST